MKITKHLSERNFLFLAILWTVGITIASLISLSNVEKVAIPGKDKAVHFVFYFIFIILWFFAFQLYKKSKYFNLKLFLIAVFYGILMEFFQSVFTKNREGDFYDAIANTFGALFGILISNLIQKQSLRSNKFKNFN